MKVGDKVDYKVNDSFVRHARVTKIHDNGKCDLAVTVHPDDYPEFSQAECLAGTGIRREIEQGTGPGTFQIPADPAAEKIAQLEVKNAALESENVSLENELASVKDSIAILTAQVAALIPSAPAA